MKDKLTNDLYKQFILLLIEKAIEYKGKIVIQPDDVKNETKEYFDENDPVKGWIAMFIDITENDKDQIKTSELYNKYLIDGNTKISMVKFSEYMKINNINTLNKMGYKYFIGLKIKE